MTAAPAGGASLAEAIARVLAGPFVWRTVMPPQGGPKPGESGPASQVSQAQRSLSAAKQAVLYGCWQRSASTRQAASEAGVSQATASRYYRRFDAGHASSVNTEKRPPAGPAR